MLVRAQGQFTADGLRQAPELGLPALLAQYASGGAAYSAVLGFRRGVAELTVNSNLHGVALNLPAPLTKTANSVLPLHFNALLPVAGGLAQRGPSRRCTESACKSSWATWGAWCMNVT